MRELYRRGVGSPYRPLTRQETQRYLSGNLCCWCNTSVPTSQSVFCSEECRVQYLVRAIPEEMRKAVRERDCGVCEICGKEDIHYCLANKINIVEGGGACGVEEIVTLCGRCVDAHNPSPAPATIPAVPEMRCRPKWKSIPSRFTRWRHLIAPVLASHLRWVQILNDYKTSGLRLGSAASARTHEHSKLCRLSRRWWKAWLTERNRDKQLRELVSLTLVDLDEQMLATTLWIGHFRHRGVGHLE